MNKIELIGRITKDIEIKYTDKGVAVVNFTMAINRPKVKDKEQEADFISVKAFKKLAENIHKYCAKGSLIYIEGSIRNNNYEDKDGNMCYTYDFIAQKAEFLSKPTNSTNKEEKEENEAKKESTSNDKIFAEFGELTQITDEDLAF